ncbi:hypothetical protein [Roseococcus sp.]|uniref:hypothetical protein n=1 Tax=Roseococcus sp. TaxID=2109646 RepID=UPI003BAAA292
MHDDDDTIRLPRAAAPGGASPSPPPLPVSRRRLTGLWIGLGAAGIAGAGGGWWWLRREGATPPVAELPPARPPSEPPAPAEGPAEFSTAEILANRTAEPMALRWASNPLVWVLDFPSLELQGRAMNRMAALLEKARAPRDRVLGDEALAGAITADGRTAATWYSGHNYRASDLARFFEQAERDHVTLNPLERWVQEQVELARRVDRSRDAAILTIPAVGAHVDAGMRFAILRHELGHGQFFTLPFFAAHVMRIWERGFSETERADMRRYLGGEGYDEKQGELMANEAMAYLLYTPDLRFFDPARDLGWSNEQANRLRAMLRSGAPEEP